MKFFAVTLFLLIGAPVLASANAVNGDRTMTKVVKMLQEMMAKSQEQGDKERDLYGKFKCYCDDQQVNREQSIKEYKIEIQQLENKIDEVQANSGGLSVQCADLKQGIADNEQARKDAEEIRMKENKEFVSEETDMVDGISSMDQAIETLAAVGADQTVSSSADHAKFMGGGEGASLLKLKASVKTAMDAVSVLLSHKQKRTMDSFLQAPFTGTYNAQSGEIVGILKNMRDTFKANLASIQAAEKTAREAHEKFMKIKEDEHAKMKADFEEKQSKLGDNDEQLASKRSDLEIVEGDLANDEEFLAKLLVMCAKKAKEFEERNMMRASEEMAISKAIAILNSDAAFESFGKVKASKSGGTGPNFLQISQHRQQSTLRSNVLELLMKAARKQKSLKIARIVALLQAENPFDTVLEEIKKMIDVIDQEGKADKEQKEWCKTERDENEKNKAEAEDSIKLLKESINTLDDDINNPETGLLAMIAETETSLQQNHDDQTTETADRAGENRNYQSNIKNIVTAEELLKKAIKVLKAYYDQFSEEEGPPELLQEEPEGGDTWEGDYKGQSEQGGSVIKTLEFIVEETHKEETEAHEEENKAQHDFEDSMEKLKEEQTNLEESLAEYQLTLAKKQKKLAEEKEELKKTEAVLKDIKNYLLKIKPGCDYIAENFEVREKNRNLEKTALEDASKMLKDTPAYKKAVVEAEQEALGDCKEICNKEGRSHVKCEACLAGTSVPGYCAGHKGTEGC